MARPSASSHRPWQPPPHSQRSTLGYYASPPRGLTLQLGCPGCTGGGAGGGATTFPLRAPALAAFFTIVE